MSCGVCGAEEVIDPIFGHTYCPLAWFPREFLNRLPPESRKGVEVHHYSEVSRLEVVD